MRAVRSDLWQKQDARLSRCHSIVNIIINDVVVPPTYSLQLFEGSDITDGTVNPGQEVRASAITDDSDINQVTLRWIKPSGDVAEETLVTGSSPYDDTYTPNEPGEWTVKADFGNGIEVAQTVSVGFFVIPESPIGIAALLASSLAALAGFLYWKRKSNKSNDGIMGLGI